MNRKMLVATALVAVVLCAVAMAAPEAHTLSAFADPSMMGTGFMLAGIGSTAVTSVKMRKHQAAKATTVAAMRAITDKAEAENRDLNAEEQTAFNGLKAQLTAANNAIAREAELVAEEASLSTATLPNGAVVVEENAEKDGKRGFATFGHFAQAVRSRPGNHPGYAMAGKLHIGSGPQAAAPTTFGNEGAGQDGGFAIPPDYAKEIFTHSLGEDSLLPMTDGNVIGGNSMVFPKDETTPWGTDGVRAYWQSEATAGTQTKPKLSNSTLRLYKLMALVPLTDELLEDTDALASYLPRKVGDSIRWKTNEAILFGSGAGQPLGAFNGNAVVTQVKEGGQATLTLLPLNIARMIARLPAQSYRTAVWLINNDVLPALWTLNQNNQLVYLPYGAGQGAMQGSPYGMLSGRPVMVSQHAKSFTAQGDVLLFDPQYVRSIQKAAGIQTATSMHIYFDADATAFRTTFRVDTQPKIVNPIAPFNGSTNLSPFVQLGAR